MDTLQAVQGTTFEFPKNAYKDETKKIWRN